MSNPFDSDLAKAIVSLALVITITIFGIAIDYYGSITAFLNVLNSIASHIGYIFSFSWINFEWITSYVGWIAVVLIALAFIFLVRFAYKNIKYLLVGTITLILENFEEKRFITNKKQQIETICDSEVKNTIQDLKDEAEKIRELIIVSRSYKKLNGFTKELKERLKRNLARLEPLERLEIEKEIEWKERRNKELDEEIRIKESREESGGYDLVYHLGGHQKNVFKKSRLSENQIKALENYGFKQINQYSIIDHKESRYLIKPKENLNHSLIHIFLVWDTIRLLNKIKGITNIQEHETVDADITFRFNNQTYALEIEKGDLLWKKEQQNKKIVELNKKYKDRWMFIVSNKNLLSKYNKLGFSTQRTRVAENLKKLLKMA
jgi:hypothetical protein